MNTTLRKISLAMLFLASIFVIVLGLLLLFASIFAKMWAFAFFNFFAIVFAIVMMVLIVVSFKEMGLKKKNQNRQEYLMRYQCDRCKRYFSTPSALGGHRSHCK